MNNKYSQNFLQDPKLVQRLIDVSSLKNTDTVIEIGPGLGIITKALAARCKNVIAIEIDPSLVQSLQLTFKNYNNVQVIKKDFLEYQLPTYGYKIFSNIPFSITAAILRKLLCESDAVSDLYLITQKQVAEKYCGEPSETLASILNKPFFDFSIIHQFSRKDFLPEANVDCSMLRAKRLTSPLVERRYIDLFRDFVCFGFAGNKSNLKKTYKDVFGHVQFLRLSTEFNFSPDAKPTNLSLSQWMGIFNYFNSNVAAFRQLKVRGSYMRVAEHK